jgi:hypothetical protein
MKISARIWSVSPKYVSELNMFGTEAVARNEIQVVCPGHCLQILWVSE